MRIYIRLAFAVALLVTMGLPLHAGIEDGLMLYFAFDKVDGDDVADRSDGGHDGVLSGGADIVDDVVQLGNGALKIEEVNAAMVVDSFTELEEYEDNSFLFWLYFIEGSNGSWSQIIAKVGPGDRSPGIWINPGSTGIHYRYDPGNAGFGAIGPNGEGSVYDLGEWYHIAGVKEEAPLTFYVNGEKKGQVGVPQAHNQGVGNLYVGKSPTYRAATFIIDELAIYNRVLEPDEIIAVMEGGLTPVDVAGKLTSTWGGLEKLH